MSKQTFYTCSLISVLKFTLVPLYRHSTCLWCYFVLRSHLWPETSNNFRTGTRHPHNSLLVLAPCCVGRVWSAHRPLILLLLSYGRIKRHNRADRKRFPPGYYFLAAAQTETTCSLKLQIKGKTWNMKGRSGLTAPSVQGARGALGVFMSMKMMWIICHGLHSHHISTHMNTYRRIWAGMLDSSLQYHHQNTEGVSFGWMMFSPSIVL